MEPLGLAKPFNAMEYYQEREKEAQTMKHPFTRGVIKRMAEKEHYEGVAKKKQEDAHNLAVRKYDAIKTSPAQQGPYYKPPGK